MTLKDSLRAEAEHVIDLGRDDQYLGGQKLAGLVLDFLDELENDKVLEADDPMHTEDFYNGDEGANL